MSEARGDMLTELAAALAGGTVRVVDLAQTLSARFPQIVLPPEFDQCAPFRMEEISRYDARGPGWYWNNISFGEHTGTHFDAPIHWITGRDLPGNATDSIPAADFVASAAVVYALAPYPFLSNLYARGAIPEALALGMLPWLLAAVWRAAHEPDPARERRSPCRRGRRGRRRLGQADLPWRVRL